MRLSDEWLSAMGQTEEGDVMVVTGRDKIGEFIQSGKFKERIEICWKYEADEIGMPTLGDAKRMEIKEEALRAAVEKNKLAILTAVYTGGGEKVWVYYTRTSPVFFQTLNDALAPFDLFPLEFEVETDAEWKEYRTMYEIVTSDGE